VGPGPETDQRLARSRQLQLLCQERAHRFEAKAGRKRGQGVHSARHLGSLAPNRIVDGQNRAPEILERLLVVNPVLGGVKGDVKDSARDGKHLDVDSSNAQQLRGRGDLLPNDVG